MSDSERAREYLLDPLNAPVPSEETGLNSHFPSTFAPAAGEDKSASVTSKPVTPPITDSSRTMSPPLQSRNPFRQSLDGAMSKDGSSIRTYPSPPPSASYRKEAFASHVDTSSSQRSSMDAPRSPKSPQQTGRSRVNSLGERYPGDMSGKPLDSVRRASRQANHAPHLQKRHIPGPDTVDRLDEAAPGGRYHHEGPYDAALLARNTSFNSSPIAAVRGTNAEALRATPKENVIDAIEQHRPLDGTAIIPPGGQDKLGRRYDYQEGENLMIELGGNYKRWPGVDYKKEDLKGKGEPTYTIEKALKEQRLRDEHHGRRSSCDNNANGIEMTDRRSSRPLSTEYHTRNSMDSSTAYDRFNGQSSSDRPKQIPASAIASGTSGVTRASSLTEGKNRRSSLDGIRRRIGSIRKKIDVSNASEILP